MDTYHGSFDDGDFLSALHHKLSTLHNNDADDSTYHAIKTHASEIDFQTANFGDLSLDLEHTSTISKSPSPVSLMIYKRKTEKCF